MCTRYLANPSSVEIARLFDAVVPETDWPVGEMFPGRAGPVIGRRADGGRGIAAMQWGFPPPPGVKAPVVNVRNTASPFWRAALERPQRRCLVPFSRFCEWGVDGATGKRRPYWFALPGREDAAFAGIWRSVPGGDGDPATHCFAFLTCAPNALVGAVHPKAMPAILDAADYDQWLDAPMADALALVRAWPDSQMAQLSDEGGEVG